MTNQIRMTNDETFRISSSLRHSSFVLRHFFSYQIDLFAFFQGYDGFLPSRPASQRSAHTSLFAGVVAGVHVHDTLLKKPFNCILDLNLVCLGTNAEDILVLLLAH